MATEKRLIDANEAIERAKNSDKIVGSSIWETGEVVEFLEDCPTVDAVEVVRCKDCKYYTEQKKRCDHPCQDWDVECYDQWLEMAPNDFCSYGERKTT